MKKRNILFEWLVIWFLFGGRSDQVLEKSNYKRSNDWYLWYECYKLKHICHALLKLKLPKWNTYISYMYSLISNEYLTRTSSNIKLKNNSNKSIYIRSIKRCMHDGKGKTLFFDWYIAQFYRLDVDHSFRKVRILWLRTKCLLVWQNLTYFLKRFNSLIN